MRILVQALTAAPNGALTMLRDLLAAWRPDDELLVLYWREEVSDALRVPGHELARVQANSTEQALLRLRFHPPESLSRFGPDVIWSQAVWIGGQPAPQAVHYQDIGSFSAVHPATVRQWLKSVRERTDLQRSDLRIYNSYALRESVHSRYPTARQQPHVVIHNGLDLSCFFSKADSGQQSSSRSAAIRILLAQSDAPHKRNWLAAHTLALLREQDSLCRDARLTIVGNGEYSDLRAALSHHGIGDCAEFTGYVSREEMASLYGTHDVVLMTGIAESFGNPIVEAHAAGRPVVTPPFAVAKELAGPLLTIADSDDAVSLSRSVGQAIRTRWSHDAGPEWAQSFSAQRTQERMRTVLHQLSGASPS